MNENINLMNYRLFAFNLILFSFSLFYYIFIYRLSTTMKGNYKPPLKKSLLEARDEEVKESLKNINQYLKTLGLARHSLITKSIFFIAC